MTKIDKKIEWNENPQELNQMLNALFVDVNRGTLQTEKYNIIVWQIAQRVSEWKASPEEIAFLEKIYKKNPDKEWEAIKAEIDDLFNSINIA